MNFVSLFLTQKFIQKINKLFFLIFNILFNIIQFYSVTASEIKTSRRVVDREETRKKVKDIKGRKRRKEEDKKSGGRK